MTIASLLSWKAGRPVKYVKDRREMLMAGTNGARDAVYHMEMAVKKDGTILGHRLKDITNEGGSAYYAGYYNTVKLTNITGLYKMKSVSLEAYSVATNKGPGGSNRGLSKPHMGFVLERMVDLAAKELGLDPAEIRFRNFVGPEELPYRTPSGNVIDAGNFHELLEKALEMVGYKHWREEQKRLRAEGRHVGIGIACNVDPGGANPGREQMVRGGPDLPGQRLAGATVRMNPLGKVTVQIGATNWGQSHETTTVPGRGGRAGDLPRRHRGLLGLRQLQQPLVEHLRHGRRLVHQHRHGRHSRGVEEGQGQDPEVRRPPPGRPAGGDPAGRGQGLRRGQRRGRSPSPTWPRPPTTG